MNQLCDSIIGEAAFEIIERVLSGAQAEERPFFRVKNLTEGECCALISRWEMASVGTRLEQMTLVVAADSHGDFPESFRADPERSITDYRNNNDSGLIYIETKVESDAQGLKNIFSLSDRDFLSGTFDDEGFSVARRILELAWRKASGKDSGPDSLLSERTISVLDLVHPNPISISVRRFTQFSLSISLDRVKIGGNLGPQEIDELVGRNLLELGLFPYEEWRAVEANNRIARGLETNALRADLAASSTSDLDIDKIQEKIGSVNFKNRDGEYLPAPDQHYWRSLCSSYLESPKKETREKIPYQIFEQLFAKDVAGLKLGDRVQGEITAKDSERLPELLGLNVIGGLNRRHQDDAIKFIDAKPTDPEVPSLFDLVGSQTQRMILKVARPRAERFTNPLVKIAEVVCDMRYRNEIEEDDELTVEVRLVGKLDENCLTPGLFSFIYSSTLKSLIDESNMLATSISLRVDDVLLTIVPPPKVNLDSDDPEETNEFNWQPLPFEFALISSKAGKQIDIESGHEWLPSNHERVALLWLLMMADDAPRWNDLMVLPDEMDLEDWIIQVSERKLELKSAVSAHIAAEISSHHVIQRFSELSQELRKAAAMAGLDGNLLADSFDQWKVNLQRAKDELAPDGLQDPHISAILQQDCMSLAQGKRVVMFPSHPFRTRWLGAYLNRSEKLLSDALSGELPLNRQNGSFYLDWISNLSPHQQPAITCNAHGKLVLASGEYGWTEEFDSIEESASPINNASIDSFSIGEIASQINSYLEAHPYKKDGFSILVVLTASAKFPSEIVKAIRARDWKDISVDVTVLAPKSAWESVSNSFEQLPASNRMDSDEKLFPPVKLSFIELPQEFDFGELFENLMVDVAIIPKFLNDEMELQENTEAPNEKHGSYDPLFDRPTHSYGGSGGGAISVSMQPRHASPAIDAWSTIAVRQQRTRPVAPNQPENTDFAELKINFSHTALLFEEVHKIAHWVITLERYITREQIESLEPRPDVLTVRENVGQSGLYTLIVSSHSGRQFIVDRLVRKLRRIVANDQKSAISGDLADRIYDETRLIAPRLALQAMGISRVTEEVLGLTIARSIAEKQYESKLKDGVVAWISLDDHPEWFQGLSAVRADLCRISLARVDGELVVEVLIVEGKLRQTYDPHGEKQVIQTLDLFRDILPSESNGFEPIDGELWRSRLISAIEDVAPEARVYFGNCVAELENGKYAIPSALSSDFRDGRFNLRSLKGLFSICLYETAGELEFTSLNEEVSVARSTRTQILDLVQGHKKEEISPVTAEEHSSAEETKEVSSTDVSYANGTDKPAAGSDALQGTEKNEHNTDELSNSRPDSGINPEGGLNKDADTSNGKLTLEQLENRYQLILDTYGQFNVPVNIPDNADDRFIEGPASVLYRLRLGIGVDPRNIYNKADSLKLALALEEKQNIRFSNHLGYVNIDVPKNESDRYFVKAEDMWKRWSRPSGSLEVPLGENHLGEVVTVNFSSSNSPHILIGGTTGSGKSEALNTILAGLTEHYSENELRLQLIDPKWTELIRFEELPHILGEIGHEAQDAIELLNSAVEEMQQRFRSFAKAKTNSLVKYNSISSAEDRVPWWVIVLDEYADLTSDANDKKEIEALLKRLAQKARAAGIHVIIATQKPSSEVISTSLRSNLPAQLALRVKSSIESRVIMDEVGAEALNGKGDAFLKADGAIVRIQCALAE